MRPFLLDGLNLSALMWGQLLVIVDKNSSLPDVPREYAYVDLRYEDERSFARSLAADKQWTPKKYQETVWEVLEGGSQAAQDT